MLASTMHTDNLNSIGKGANFECLGCWDYAMRRQHVEITYLLTLRVIEQKGAAIRERKRANTAAP